MDKLPHKLPKLTQKEIENLNRSIRNKETESVTQNLPIKQPYPNKIKFKKQNKQTKKPPNK